MGINKEKKRKQVVLACTSCRSSKTACDDSRPCHRCIARGIGDSCVDAPKKRRCSTCSNNRRVQHHIVPKTFVQYHLHPHSTHKFIGKNTILENTYGLSYNTIYNQYGHHDSDHHESTNFDFQEPILPELPNCVSCGSPHDSQLEAKVDSFEPFEDKSKSFPGDNSNLEQLLNSPAIDALLQQFLTNNDSF